MNRPLALVAVALIAGLSLVSSSAAHAQQEGLRLAPVPQAQDVRVLKRMVEGWSDGDPIPYGYHAERKPRIGLLVSGSLTFAVPYALGALIADKSESKEMFLPVIGPFIMAGKTDSQPSSSPTWRALRTLGVVVTVAAGVVQAAGVAMIVAGAAGKYVLVADTVTVTPMVLPSGAGVGVSGQF